VTPAVVDSRGQQVSLGAGRALHFRLRSACPLLGGRDQLPAGGVDRADGQADASLAIARLSTSQVNMMARDLGEHVESFRTRPFDAAPTSWSWSTTCTPGSWPPTGNSSENPSSPRPMTTNHRPKR